MLSFSSLLLTSTVVAGVLSSALPNPRSGDVGLSPRSGTPSSAGIHDGYYYNFWTDGTSDVTYTNKAGGEYNVSWSGGGNFYGGKGWNPGSAR